MYQKTVSSLKSNRNHRAVLWLDNSNKKPCMHAKTPLNETINLETWYIQIYDCWNGLPTLDILIPVLCAVPFVPDMHLPLVPQWCSSPATLGRLFWTQLVVSCLLCFFSLYWNLLFLAKSYVFHIVVYVAKFVWLVVMIIMTICHLGPILHYQAPEKVVAYLSRPIWVTLMGTCDVHVLNK